MPYAGTRSLSCVRRVHEDWYGYDARWYHQEGVNYEQIIQQVERSAGYDSDDNGLDWRAMNVNVGRGRNALRDTDTDALGAQRQ